MAGALSTIGLWWLCFPRLVYQALGRCLCLVWGYEHWGGIYPPPTVKGPLGSCEIFVFSVEFSGTFPRGVLNVFGKFRFVSLKQYNVYYDSILSCFLCGEKG